MMYYTIFIIFLLFFTVRTEKLFDLNDYVYSMVYNIPN